MKRLFRARDFEPDPRRDIEGWDTAVKALLLANSIWDTDLSLKDVEVRGIGPLIKGVMAESREKGLSPKLMGKASRSEEEVRVSVVPTAVDSGHPLFGVRGTDKGITFWTDTMGTVTVTGGGSDPVGAAAAMLKDLIHLHD